MTEQQRWRQKQWWAQAPPLHISLEGYWQEASQVLEQLLQTQIESIRRAGQLFAECIEQEGVLQVYGTGHSRVLAMELAGRAGGLVPVNRIDLEDLAIRAYWPLERVCTRDVEHDLEAGQAILACYQIKPKDVFLIVSHSGGNAAIVEVAQRVKAHGHTLVALTSLDHARQAASHHPSGKKLYELADIVIDNCSPYGDALLELPGGGKACSVSSLCGVIVMQMLTAETIRNLVARDIDPPIFMSANIPGGIEQGQMLRQRYRGRINEHW